MPLSVSLTTMKTLRPRSVHTLLRARQLAQLERGLICFDGDGHGLPQKACFVSLDRREGAVHQPAIADATFGVALHKLLLALKHKVVCDHGLRSSSEPRENNQQGRHCPRFFMGGTPCTVQTTEASKDSPSYSCMPSGQSMVHLDFRNLVELLHELRRSSPRATVGTRPTLSRPAIVLEPRARQWAQVPSVHV